MGETQTGEAQVQTNETQVKEVPVKTVSPFSSERRQAMAEARKSVVKIEPVQTESVPTEQTVKPIDIKMQERAEEIEKNKAKNLFPGSNEEEKVSQQIEDLAPKVSVEQKAASLGKKTPDQEVVKYDNDLQVAIRNMLNDRSDVNIGLVEALKKDYMQFVSENKDNLSENSKKQFLNTWTTNQFPMPEGFEAPVLRKSAIKKFTEGISKFFNRGKTNS